MWPHTLKMTVSIWRNLSCSCRQKINFILKVSFEILQRDCKLNIYGTLGTPGYAHPSADKKSTLSLMFFWRYWKIIQTYYFGYFGHAWQHTPKIIVSSCRKLQCLSYLHAKNELIISFFLEILHFKDSCSLIGPQEFDP